MHAILLRRSHRQKDRVEISAEQLANAATEVCEREMRGREVWDSVLPCLGCVAQIGVGIQACDKRIWDHEPFCLTQICVLDGDLRSRTTALVYAAQI